MKFPRFFIGAIFLIVYVFAQSEHDVVDDNAYNNPGYPTYDTIPQGLSFSCQSRGPGYYADPETGCQVWHWCLPSGAKYSFLCPNGTLFNQRVRVCDWWFNVDCPDSPNIYNINDDLYKDADGNPI